MENLRRLAYLTLSPSALLTFLVSHSHTVTQYHSHTVTLPYSAAVLSLTVRRLTIEDLIRRHHLPICGSVYLIQSLNVLSR